MKTTVEFLNAIKARYELPSDGRLAVMLGLTRASISRFMQGKDNLGDETAMKVAALLDLDPAYVVACIHAERAKRSEEKKLWERIAARIAECDHLPEKLTGLALTLALVALVPFGQIDASGMQFALAGFTMPEAAAGTLYIMSN